MSEMLAAAGAAPVTEFGCLDCGSPFDPLIDVLGDPATWLSIVLAAVIGAMAAGILCKFGRRMKPIGIIMLAGASPLFIVAGLIAYAGLFVRDNGFEGLLDMLINSKISVVLSLLFIAGLLGARVSLALFGKRTKATITSTFE